MLLDVTLEEVRIESYFPLDEATRTTCEKLAETHDPDDDPSQKHE